MPLTTRETEEPTWLKAVFFILALIGLLGIVFLILSLRGASKFRRQRHTPLPLVYPLTAETASWQRSFLSSSSVTLLQESANPPVFVPQHDRTPSRDLKLLPRLVIPETSTKYTIPAPVGTPVSSGVTADSVKKRRQGALPLVVPDPEIPV